MEWNVPSERTTADSSIVADMNKFRELILLLAGNGLDQPSSDIESLKTLVDNVEIRSAVKKTANYVILDDDGYTRIEVDTTAGDVTITLPTKADNLRRQIEIAHIAGANKIIISPDGADANTLTNDGLSAIWLPKIDDFIKLQESADSGKWEVLNERISAGIMLNTYAGHGSTDTRIVRYTNVQESYGNMFSENHSSGYSGNADGLEITINRSGRYHINLIHGSSSASDAVVGFSKNSNQLTTDIQSITITHVIGYISIKSGGYADGVGVAVTLAKNDIIRPHAYGGIVPVTAAGCRFTVTYLGC